MTEVAMSRFGARRRFGPSAVVRWRRVANAAYMRPRAHHAGIGSLRRACSLVGVIAPIVLLAGVADSVHEIAWFVYYGWGANIPAGAAAGAPAWLAWVVVAGLALLGWWRLAAVAAWLATAGMVVAVATFALIPTPYMGAWFLLAVLTAIALTFSPSQPRGVAVVGKRSVLVLAGMVVAVVFTRLLGHHFTVLYLLAWIGLGAVAVRAVQRRTASGRRALLLLAVPALCAFCVDIEVHARTLYPSLFSGGPALSIVLAELYAAPVVIVSSSWLVLRRWERSRPGSAEVG